MSRKLIFGGAFNPVHIGHVRAAIEVSEALDFGHVEWVPSFAPLHKTGHTLLPFDIRMALLRAALEGDRRSSVNAIERDLPVPSVTVQTLEAMTRSEPAVERHFLLGDREFLRLHKWRAGSRVVELADIAVVCRTEFNHEEFAAQVVGGWPRSRRVTAPPGALMAFELLPGRRAVVVGIPRIDISSSLVRQKWLAGHSVAHLVPEPAIALLEQNRAAVQAAWDAAADSSLRAS
jgi:nicotinate-nucleotide adenylyltransferase